MAEGDLRAALNLFDPRRPLENGELTSYYVSRPHAPLAEMETYLRNSDNPVKVLFSGHRGSGKSTELRRLAMELDSEFFVVQVSVANTLNVSDLNYADIILACTAALVRKVIAQEEYVPLHDALLQEILVFLENEVISETTITTPQSPSIGGKLNILIGSIEAKFGKETITREAIRKRLFPRIADLVERINAVCKSIRDQMSREPLIIVEDIDKTDLAHATDLFFNHTTTLNSLDCHTIYTFPIPLCYDNRYTERIGDYSERFLLPNVALQHRSGDPHPEGKATLKDVVTRRVSETLFTSDALDTIIELSGGLMRNLIRLVNGSALLALTRKEETIHTDVVREVAARVGNEYRRLLLPLHYEALEKIRQSKEISPDETVRQLLENLSLLEYSNATSWCDVQPIVRSLLDERKSQSPTP